MLGEPIHPMVIGASSPCSRIGCLAGSTQDGTTSTDRAHCRAWDARTELPATTTRADRAYEAKRAASRLRPRNIRFALEIDPRYSASSKSYTSSERGGSKPGRGVTRGEAVDHSDRSLRDVALQVRAPDDTTGRALSHAGVLDIRSWYSASRSEERNERSTPWGRRNGAKFATRTRGPAAEAG